MIHTTLTKNWFRWALFSLAVIALYGALMRYKIAFSFPFFDQKNLLHAHSHFAFSGWVSHVLYSGLALLILPFVTARQQAKYKVLVAANLFCAFGMLIAFTIQGYAFFSITLSTLSIVVAVIYAYIFIKDSQHFPAGHPSKNWAITGLLLNVLSAAGPLSLAYMMASKNIHHDFYLGSVYYFLHFQYSGWFFFGSMALVAGMLPSDFPSLKKYFWVFAGTVIPTFFLSLLWTKLALWLYIITVIATITQLIAWIMLLVKCLPVIKQKRTVSYPNSINIFFYAAATALTIKFVLQAISVIPSLSQLVFGFRPIVIGYLHLVLLGIYSLFIIGYLFANRFIQINKTAKLAAFGFLSGVLLNEFFLGTQGLAAFTYTVIPFINELLLAAALILFSSAVLLAFSQRKQ